MLVQFIGAVISGIIQPLLSWWSTYRQGRLAERAKRLEGTLEKEREITDALEKGLIAWHSEFILGPDGRVYRRTTSSPPAPGIVPDPKPDAK